MKLQSHVAALNIKPELKACRCVSSSQGWDFSRFFSAQNAKWNDLHWLTSCDSKGFPGALKVLIEMGDVYPKIPKKKSTKNTPSLCFLEKNPPQTTKFFTPKPHLTDRPSDQRWTQPPPSRSNRKVFAVVPDQVIALIANPWHGTLEHIFLGRVLKGWCHWYCWVVQESGKLTSWHREYQNINVFS